VIGFGDALLAVLLFLPAWRAPRITQIGHGGDPGIFIWYLPLDSHALARLQNPLITHALNYPNGVNVMGQTSILFPALVLTPITMTLGAEVAWNVLMTGALALSALSASVCMRPYVTRWVPAAMGGVLFGFSPFEIAQSLGHPNLRRLAVVPVALSLTAELASGNLPTRRVRWHLVCVARCNY
jgi:hypothetical protein